MEILVSLSHATPVVIFEGTKPVRLLVSFGHRAEDIQAAIGEQVEGEFLSRVLALWQDPDQPREYVPQGKDLLIRPGVGVLPVDSTES